MAEAAREHEVAEAHALGHRRERRCRRPRLEGGHRRQPRRVEVVHEPDGVDAEAVAGNDARAEVVPGEADLREVDADVGHRAGP